MINEKSVMVRHSGRAHIRGKIRRVWRPRYLQLLDNGLVRYFEGEIPKSTLVIYTARILDVTTFRDLHVGLPNGTYGFVFHAKRLLPKLECHPPENTQPRDFLCAVATLEEAQSWVVALQWAATLHPSSEGWDYDYYEDEEEEYYASAIRRNALEVVAQKKQTSPKEKKLGKIVVSRVHNVQIVQTAKFQFDVGYEIELLLLRSFKKTNQMLVEERCLVRTKQNLTELLQRLQEEVGRTGNNTLQQAQQALRQLSVKNPRSLKVSVDVVDKTMRILSMDPVICNAKSMRKFYCIAASPSNAPSNLFFLHDPTSFSQTHALTCTSRNPDEFVKPWLQLSVNYRMSPKWCVLWLVQHPITMGVVGCIVAFAMSPVWKCYNDFMVSLNVRLDVLVFSLITALRAGQTWGRLDAMRPVATPILAPTVTPPTVVPEARFEEEASLLEDSALEESIVDVEHSTTTDEEGDEEDSLEEEDILSSPLPQYPANGGVSCWSKPPPNIFRVRSETYLENRVKVPSAREPFVCKGVHVWLSDNPERHICRHDFLQNQLGPADHFVINFLLPFGNFVACFEIPPLAELQPNLRKVWKGFVEGNQQYRDARLKLLPVVVDGPWIVKRAVGPGTSPALLGKVIPLQYYFGKGRFEVDIIITASRIAKGILSVVKGHTNMLTIAFAFIIEAAEQEELPETVLCTFQMHSLCLEKCPPLPLPECNADDVIN